MPGLRRAAGVEIAAVASRDAARARAFADETGIETSYGTYEELLADPTIDVIYNPLPNSMHVEWTRRAAEAGKHVMCEKPMGIDAAELDVLLPLAEQVHIAEAFMVRFHPQWHETRELVRSGRLGSISHVHAAFQYRNTDGSNIRNQADVGGGALYDIGCYAIVAARWFLEADPVRVVALVDRDPEFGTDRLTSAILDFGDGRMATFQVSTQAVFHQRVTVHGTEGRLELTIPFNHPQHDPVTYLVHHGQSVHGLDAERFEVAAADHYALPGRGVLRRVRTEPPTTGPLLDAVTNMRIIDAVFRSAESGRFEPV
ncbi:MAG: Gfo/Idh/MocA family oxidoreductase [Ilumatobacteraceae bacterium]